MKTIAQLFDLSGKGVVVTGGARGIGKGIAIRLAEAGASVMIADIEFETAIKTEKQIKTRGGKVQAIHADVRIEADAEKVVQATVGAFGSLDILVNNAGIFPSSKFLTTKIEEWNNVMDTNLKGIFHFSQAAARVMINNQNGGKIINISSMDAIKPIIGHAHYASSKSGVALLTKTMALELAPKILVNAVAPGGIQTPGGDLIRESMCKSLGMADIEKLHESFLKTVPLRRLGEPDDIAKVVLFLASGASDFMTGEMMLVDGGHLLC